MCVENAKEGSVCLVELHASGEEEDRGRGSERWRGWGGRGDAATNQSTQATTLRENQSRYGAEKNRYRAA